MQIIHSYPRLVDAVEVHLKAGFSKDQMIRFFGVSRVAVTNAMHDARRRMWVQKAARIRAWVNS